MKRISLKYAVRELTECRPLEPDELARLRRLGVRTSWLRRRWLRVAVFALPLVLTSAWSLDRWQQHALHQAVADEIAYNHLAAQPLDILSDDPQALDLAFANIGLSLVRGPSAQPEQGRLIGARHCSIQSVPAAQLRYAMPTGPHATVYQAVYDAGRHGRLPRGGGEVLNLQARGIDITLWQDRGVIMAIARPAGAACPGVGC
jgi:anti-sigma factor RsiW